MASRGERRMQSSCRWAGGTKRAKSGSGAEVVVDWRACQDAPDPHPPRRPDGGHLQRAWSQAAYPLALQMGFPFTLPQISPQLHAHLAFEGYQFAKDHGEGNDYNRRVLK